MLSDHEKEQLAQIEAGLYEQDKKFAKSMRREGSTVQAGIGILIAFAGMAVVLTGAAMNQAAIGVVGFILALAGVYWTWRSLTTVGASGPAIRESQASGGGEGGFMGKMEKRWEKRQENGDG